MMTVFCMNGFNVGKNVPIYFTSTHTKTKPPRNINGCLCVRTVSQTSTPGIFNTERQLIAFL